MLQAWLNTEDSEERIKRTEEGKRTESQTHNELVTANWPVLWCPVSDVAVVQSPAVLQRPAASSQAGQHQPVSLQHHLLPRSTPLQVGGYLWNRGRMENMLFLFSEKGWMSPAWTIEPFTTIKEIQSCSVLCTKTPWWKKYLWHNNVWFYWTHFQKNL